VFGDLRYDRERELGFAEIETQSGGCPEFVPGWTPPRADLLGLYVHRPRDRINVHVVAALGDCDASGGLGRSPSGKN
jgi:hypothetical protein